MKNIVYIATSIDGYIADRNGCLDWLSMIPNPDNLDFGWSEFIEGIDAILMGRITFETVCAFNVPWPYSKPVYVLSNTLEKLPNKYQDNAKLFNGPPIQIVEKIRKDGYKNLYIDGSTTIQNFLKDDLIDEMIITTIPIILGGGIKLFSELPKEMKFELVKSEVLLGQIVKNTYKRKNNQNA